MKIRNPTTGLCFERTSASVDIQHIIDKHEQMRRTLRLQGRIVNKSFDNITGDNYNYNPLINNRVFVNRIPKRIHNQELVLQLYVDSFHVRE
jgi:hypothetical protein